MDTNKLRTIAAGHIGIDLPERLATAVAIQSQQAQSLAEAADEIDRLQARLRELEGTMPEPPSP
jgi:hypothetical protein